MNYYTLDEYSKLKAKYSRYSSWAIWNPINEADTTIIDNQYEYLNTRFVLVGLNASGRIKDIPWINFHGGKHDRKLKYACNDTYIKGGYITDLFKDIPEAKSSRFASNLTEDQIRQNINFFLQEMRDIKMSDNTKMIILGAPNSALSKLFNKHFKKYFENDVCYYYHYSYFNISDKQWVSGLWDRLELTADFEETHSRYSNTHTDDHGVQNKRP